MADGLGEQRIAGGLRDREVEVSVCEENVDNGIVLVRRLAFIHDNCTTTSRGSRPARDRSANARTACGSFLAHHSADGNERRPVRGNVDSLTKVVQALEDMGVELLGEGSVSTVGGRGVRLRDREVRMTQMRADQHPRDRRMTVQSARADDGRGHSD